jgi:hypothetical protein
MDELASCKYRESEIGAASREKIASKNKTSKIPNTTATS